MKLRTKIIALAIGLFGFGSMTEQANAQVRAQITIGSSPYRTPVYRYYHGGRYYQRPYSYYSREYYGYRRHDNGWHRGWYKDRRDWRDNRNWNDNRRDMDDRDRGWHRR